MKNILNHIGMKEEKAKKRMNRINPNSVNFTLQEKAKPKEKKEELISNVIQRNFNSPMKNSSPRKKLIVSKFENGQRKFSENETISNKAKKNVHSERKNDTANSKVNKINFKNFPKSDQIMKQNNSYEDLSLDYLKEFNENLEEEVFNDSLNDSLLPKLESINDKIENYQMQCNDYFELSEIKKLDDEPILNSDISLNKDVQNSNRDLIQIKN